jgi:hypothetical protein
MIDPERVITNVYRFENGNVMCFDQFGQQMGEYQGDDAIEKIRAAGYTKPIETHSWKPMSHNGTR